MQEETLRIVINLLFWLFMALIRHIYFTYFVNSKPLRQRHLIKVICISSFIIGLLIPVFLILILNGWMFIAGILLGYIHNLLWNVIDVTDSLKYTPEKKDKEEE